MAHGYLGLEITPSKIRYAYTGEISKVSAELRTGVSLHKMDILHPGALASCVQSILNQENIQPKQIFVSISRPDILIRLINLPKLRSNEFEEVISSEIEKVPFFATRRFDFIFQKIAAAGDKDRVVYAAIDQAVLDYIHQEISSLKLPFRHIEITPLNLSGLLPIDQANSHEDQAIILVHDRTSYLLITRDQKYQLIYQLAGGSENLYPQNKDNINDVSLLTFKSELQRVLKSYAMDNRGTSLKRLWIIWDEGTGKDLDRHLSKQLGLEVAPLKLDQLPHIHETTAPSNPIAVLPMVPVLYFLNKLKAQFPPDHFFREFQVKHYALRTVSLTLIFLSIITLLFGLKIHSDKKERIRLTQQARQMEQQIEDLKKQSQDLYKKRDEYLSMRQNLLDQATYVNLINRVTWPEVLAVVAKKLPEQVCLTTFEFNESGQASFKGAAIEVESVADLIRQVSDSSLLTNGKFDFLKEKQIETQKYFSFGILAQLKLPSEENHEHPNN